MVFGTKPRKTNLRLFPSFKIRQSIEEGGMSIVYENSSSTPYWESTYIFFSSLSKPNITSLNLPHLSHNHGVGVKSIVNEGVENESFQCQSFEASLKYFG